MGFSQIVNKIRKEAGTDPQYAKILNDGKVIFAFMKFGYSPYMGGRHFFIPTDEHRKKLTEMHAKILEIGLSNYPISVHVEYEDEYTDTIVLTYTPKSKKELEEIRKFLENTPVDGGKLPQKGATFFGYD